MNEFQRKTPQQMQIYTVAQASRPNKINIEQSTRPTSTVFNHQPSSQLSMQVKEILQKKHTVKAQFQPQRRLPMGMIVSKMATRTPIVKESEDPVPSLQDIDLSMLRKHKLTPPYWWNKPRQNKSPRPTEFEKLMVSMKEKLLKCDSKMHNKPNAHSQESIHSEVAKIVANARNAEAGSHTSVFDNYDQLYGKCRNINENATETAFLDEDPIGDCLENGLEVASNTNHQCTQTNTSINRSPKIKFEFNPNCEIPQPEFKWNPVILNSGPNIDSPLSWLSSQRSSEPDVFQQYENSYGQNFLLPEHEFRDQFSVNLPADETFLQLIPPTCDYGIESNSTHSNLSTFLDHSSSPDKWETVAEERLQLTLYASDRPIIYSSRADYPNNSKRMRPNRSKRNFLEEE